MSAPSGRLSLGAGWIGLRFTRDRGGEPSRRGPRAAEEKWAFLFIAPMLLGLAVLSAGPILATFAISLTQWDLLRAPELVGFDNYVRLLGDKRVLMLYVTGKKFETNNVDVRHDGITETCTINSTSRCGLQEGMTVKVRGAFSGTSYTASAITQEDTLEGPIASKNQVAASNGTLTILGQTVLVDDTTKFDDRAHRIN